MSKIFQNYRGVAQVFQIMHNYTVPAETCQPIYFHELCKKYLTIGSELHYNWRRAFYNQKILHNCPQKVLDNPGICLYTTRVGTGSAPKTTRLEKNFVQLCKKDLTNRSRTGKMARETPIESKLHFRTGAAAPKFSRRQARPGLAVFHVEHYAASRSHRMVNKFLMPRFLSA